MKRFISALSSLCLAATTVISAFPVLSASAAGSADWTIGKKTVSGGVEVSVPVTVNGDKGTSGFIADLAYDSALTFSGITWGNAYTGEATIKEDEVRVVWADNDGENQTAADDAVVFYLNFTAPAASGEYPITIDELEVVDTDGDPLTISSKEGAVIVKQTVPAGSVGWDIAEKTVAGGSEVSVPVTVTGDKGTSGFIADFEYDTALKFTGITWGKAYTGEATINDNELRVVWADNDGNDQTAADDAVVLYLNFTAPAGSGRYPVTFSELSVVNTDGGELTLVKDDGAVIVSDADAGSVNWEIDEKIVDAGAEVKVPVTVTGDAGTSGFIADFSYDDALTFTGFTWGDAYTGEATINEDEIRFVWADDNGDNQTAADDAVVLYLNFTAPDEAGTYEVTFDELSVVNTNGGSLAVTSENGAVIVKDPNAGSSSWDIGEETVKPGAEAKVPVIVTGDEGTSGFVVDFEYDDALTFTGITWGEAYTGEATLNENELRVVWADNDGDNQTAADDAVVLYLNFTAPDEAGEYPVTFGELEVVDTNGAALTLVKEDGAVIVEDDNDETTTTAPIVPGTVGWYIGEETVAGGAEAKVPVTIKGDAGTAGFVVDFDYDDALTFEGITWGEAYTGEATVNGDEVRVVWADDNGDNQTAADDAIVLYLNFTAPDEDGEYPVTFNTLEVVDGDGNPLTLAKEDGAVIVVSETTTTPGETTTTVADTTTTPGETTTTVADTTTTPTPGETTTTVADTTTTPGETTTTVADTTTTPGETTTTVADTTTTPGETTTTVADTTTTPGETTTTVADTTTTPGETTTTVADTTTTPGETTTTVADTTTTPGETTTTVADTTTTPGETTTTVADTTTTPSETTTTPVIPDPGHAVYQIDDVNALAGQTGVRVPVYVWYDEGTAGLTMQFDIADGFEITGIEFGDAYGDADQVVWNEEDYTFIWSDPNGENQIAPSGAVILYLIVDVPADAEEETKYPVIFVPGSVSVSDTDSNDVEFSTVDGSIFILESLDDPGNVVYNIGDVDATPGSKVDVPVEVWFDEGTASFSMTFDIPEGFVIDTITFGEEYAENGKFTFDPETNTLIWTSNDGSNYVPDPGQLIATLTLTVPDDAVVGEVYPITITDVVATDSDGNDLKYTVNDGSITIVPVETTTTPADTTTTPGETTTTVADTTTTPGETTTTPGETTTTVADTTTTPGETTTTVADTTTTPGETTTTVADTTTTPSETTTTVPDGDFTVVTSYSTSYEAPTRVNYWSHDPRTFEESGGLDGLSAYIYIWKYYVDADGYFVNAEGDQLLDADGNAMKYDAENPVYPDGEFAFEAKSMDVTAYTNPAEDADSPVEVYVAGQHKYPIPVYYDSALQEDPDFVLGDGSPLFFGEFKIYIGLKGDTQLDDDVDANDAQLTLNYYLNIKILGNEYYTLNEDPELQDLAFYVSDVFYKQELNANTAQMILNYYLYNKILHTPTSWTDLIGYDFPDSFFEDTQ